MIRRLHRGGPPVSEDEYSEVLGEVVMRVGLQQAHILGLMERTEREVLRAQQSAEACCVACTEMLRKSVNGLTPDQHDRYNDMIIDGCDEWDALVQIEDEDARLG